MLGPISELVGGALSYFGAKKANEMNKKIAQKQMDFQRESSREQMAFQERMSNTAYQRSMEDMKKAGLNPILAFQQGGASSPSGSSSSGSSYEYKDQLSKGVSTALQARMMEGQLKQIESQVKQINAMTDLAKAELPSKLAEGRLYSGKHATMLKFLEKAANVASKFT